MEIYLKKSLKLTNVTSIRDIIVIRRMFLTSSRKYAAFKVQHAPTVNEKRFYASIPYPRFLWIMELGTKDQYKGENDGLTQRVFAEYILDATSNSIQYLESAILIRVGKNVGYKLFDENVYDDVNFDQEGDSNNSFRITTRFFGGKDNKSGYDFENELISMTMRKERICLSSCILLCSLAGISRSLRRSSRNTSRKKIQMQIVMMRREMHDPADESTPDQLISPLSCNINEDSLTMAPIFLLNGRSFAPFEPSSFLPASATSWSVPRFSFP